MKKLKYAILIMIIVIIIITLKLLSITNTKAENNKDNNAPNNNVINFNNTVSRVEYIENQNNIVIDGNSDKNETTRVKNNKLFYTIENCIKKFEIFVNLNYEEQVNKLNQPSIAAEYEIYDENAKAEAILQLLDDSYIEKNGINSSNVMEYVDATLASHKVEALKINKLKNSSDINIYSVYAKKTINQKVEYLYYIVKIGKEKKFCVYPIKDSKYNNIDEVKVEYPEGPIKVNDRNTYIDLDINDSQIATRYFQEYKELMLNNPNEAYNKLDFEYRNKRFGNIDEFKNYINNNRENIELMQVYRYEKKEERYIIKDRYENIYIFLENAPKDYVVKLDDYTIQTEEYKKSYEKSMDSTKVRDNIKKFIWMINNKDYKNAYNLLNSTFKENNYNTLEKFISTLENKMFTINKIDSLDISESGDNYICSLKLSDYKYEFSNIISMQIIIKLGEGTNFEMSFNIE